MNDALIVGAVLVILVCALGFYLMSRVSYLEKKMGLMEAVLIDIKVAMESIEQEQEQAVPPPLPPLPATAAVRAPEAVGAQVAAPTESDEKFYSSVLEEVAEVEAEVGAPAEAEAGVEAVAVEAKASVGPNYDSMTRTELVTLAEQRGLRVPKRLSRGEVISLLRSNDSSRNDGSSTGTDNASGPAGSLFSAGAPLSGDFPVDLGQNDGAPLEEAAI